MAASINCKHACKGAGLLLALSLLLAPATQATAEVVLSGFGTLGYAQSNSDNSPYLRGEGGEGADSDGTFKVDTRLGIQMDSHFNERFSATLQGVARQNYEGNFKPKAQWAFIKTQLSDSQSLRLGRMSDPLFRNSQTRDVGYVSTDLRMPQELYNQSNLSYFDGLDYTHHFALGQSDIAARLYTGESKSTFSGIFVFRLEDIAGFTLDGQGNNTSWRLGYNHASISYSSPTINAAETALSAASGFFPELQVYADDFSDRKRTIQAINLGATVEGDAWSAEAEWLTIKGSGVVPDTNAWYAIARYQFARWTPYAYVASARQTSRRSLPAPSTATLNALIDLLRLAYLPIDQDTLALGVRWDFARKFALKAQVDWVSRASHGVNFARPVSNTVNNDDVVLASIALDFVF